MADCECLEGCPFFNDMMAEKPGFSELLKKRFCRGDNTTCARYMIFKTMGKGNVPEDLYPNQHDVAEKMIASG